jgi:CubicO group peptidase (beta-lactamase class C family)
MRHSVMTRRAALAGLLAAPEAWAQSLTDDVSGGPAADRMPQTARYSHERGGGGFIAMRHGVAIAESHANGSDPTMALPWRSASAGFALVLAAALARDRLLTLDEPAAFTLPEWSAEPNKQRITIRHLLQQTSGLATLAPGAASPILPDVIAAPGVYEPGQAFHEDPTGLQAFAEIVRRKLIQAGAPGDPATYLQLRALENVGASPVIWSRQADGLMDLANGAAASLRAIARLAEFVRRRGLWRANFQVHAPTLDAGLVGSFASAGRVGFGWRLADGAALTGGEPLAVTSDLWGASDFPADIIFLANNAGGRLFVAPSHALVVGRTALSPGGPAWSDAAFLRLAISGA